MDIHNRDVSPGKEIHGFRVRNAAHVPRIDSFVYELAHMESGTSYVHVANNDKINTFTAMLKTLPGDSSGIPHILEHLIFCGSRKFPVRDPFHPMCQRSANVFMNGYTSSDNTQFIFATPDREDFYNLLDLFLDWVFFPLLRETDFVRHGAYPGFREGGSRSGLVYKGIVYNEMKGALSAPGYRMNREILRNIYPGSPYRHHTGGDPEEIPGATWGQVRRFHQDHYHPGNAFFYTYGNLPLTPHLAVLDKKIYSHFSGPGKRPPPPVQPRWEKPRQRVRRYGPGSGGPSRAPRQTGVAWLTGDGGNPSDVLMNKLLSRILLGNMSAPLKRGLLRTKLGYTLCDGAGADHRKKDVLFTCGLKGAEKSAHDEILPVILGTFKSLAKTGLGPDRIRSALNRLAFQYRETTHHPYPFGIKLFLLFSGLWLHGGSVIQYLDIATSPAKLAGLFDPEPFCGYLSTHFTHNPHRLLLTLEPGGEKGPSTRPFPREALNRAAQWEKAIESDRGIVEDIGCLPAIGLTRVISRKREVPRSETRGRVWLCPQPTNGILHFLAAFGTAGLEKRLAPLLPFFCYALFKSGTAHRHFSKIDGMAAAYTGGLQCTVQVLPDFRGNGAYISQILIKAKCFDRDRDQLFDILGDVLANFDGSNPERLKTLVRLYEAGLKTSMLRNGHFTAALLAGRKFSSFHFQKERMKGVHPLQRMQKLAGRLTEQGLWRLSMDLAAIKSQVIGKNNIKPGLVGPGNSVSMACGAVETLVGSLPETPGPSFFSKPKAVAGRPVIEGWDVSSPASFAAMVFDTVPVTHPDAASLAVISRITWLFVNREIREKRGAYGASSQYEPETGLFSFHSQNDPNAVSSLDAFRKAVSFIIEGRFGRSDIERAVFMEMVKLTRPDSPAETGLIAFYRHLIALHHQALEAHKRAIAKVTRQTLVSTAEKYLSGHAGNRGVVILSGKNNLEKLPDWHHHFKIRSI